ncbi:hypothetical protein [Methylomonas sp. AM2-LC]|uniref:hypothetical protein n=1 Tax=Methylomonas sp. AM2-LC TaxID=3153301 RepID=UPI0032658C07
MKHNTYYYALTAIALSAGYMGLHNLNSVSATPKLQSDKQLTTLSSVDQNNMIQAAAKNDPIAMQVSTITSNDKILVETEHRALGDILRDVEIQNGIHFILSAQTANKIILINLKGAHLEAGLHTLFNGLDTFYQFTSSNSSPARLSKVWIYPAGEADTLSPASLSASETKSNRLTELTPAKTSFTEQSDAPIQPVAEKTINALHSNNPNVRLQVLTQFQHSGLSLPRDVLEKMLTSDESDKIREAALLSIAALPGVSLDELKKEATGALNDNSESVRSAAKDLLDKIEAGVNAPQPIDDEGGAG